MEVGAVKQAFNNELILLKKKLNQAKIQIIHKLTRRAKTLVEKKCPEKIKEKYKRKAEAAVNEVLIIKKINPKDLARFIITHKGELNSYINKPTVDQDKACARLLLHKALQDKYKLIRERFTSVPIEDLLMSREERKKIKKEAREKQKNKKKGKGDNKVVNSEGNWDVEDVEMPLVKSKIGDDVLSHNDNLSDDNNAESGDDDTKAESGDEGNNSIESDGLPANINGVESDELEDNNDNDDISDKDDDNEADDAPEDSNDSESEGKKSNDVGKFVKATPEKIIHKPLILSPKPVDAKIQLKPKEIKKVEKKPRDKNRQDKNKNLNEKLLSRKFKKELNETPVQETKVADPFFITSTGENYMSIAEPRQPDEVKEEHMQGNRKLRRAVMFGHVPNIKPRRDDFRQGDRFNRNNNSFNKNDSFNKFNNNSDSSDKRNFTDKRNNFNRNRLEDSKPEKEEKLHPSWEAKKKQSGILPFQGKKIVFDES